MDHATSPIEHPVDAGYEALLAAAEDKIAHLEVALTSSRRIGAAVGIVMANRKLTEEEAFEVLRRLSQDANRKLRDIADDVVWLGTSDEPPTPRESRTRQG